MKVTEHAGSALKYLAVEPEGYEPGKPYPMIVLLHGYGSHMGDLASLCPVIDRIGYVYICPNAPLPLGMGFGSSGFAWAPFPMSEIASAEGPWTSSP